MTDRHGRRPPKKLHDVSAKIKLNRWAIFALLVASALVTILYVDNVMRVNDLLTRIQRLEKSRDNIRSGNQELMRRLNELESADRIVPLARERLGLDVPRSAPQKLP
ncbi:MAG: hypothetical protein ACLFQX_00280 [Candidatus Kapaibacterium sp.]